MHLPWVWLHCINYTSSDVHKITTMFVINHLLLFIVHLSADFPWVFQPKGVSSFVTYVWSLEVDKWQIHKLFSRRSLIDLDSDICTPLCFHHEVACSFPKHPYLNIVVTYRIKLGMLNQHFTEHIIVACTVYNNTLISDMSFMCALCSLGMSLLPEFHALLSVLQNQVSHWQGWSCPSHCSCCIPNTASSDRLSTSSQPLPSDIKWQCINTWGNKRLIPVNSCLCMMTPEVFIREPVTNILTLLLVCLSRYTASYPTRNVPYAIVVRCIYHLMGYMSIIVSGVQFQFDYFFKYESFVNLCVILALGPW